MKPREKEMYARLITEADMTCRDCSYRAGLSNGRYREFQCSQYPDGKPVPVVAALDGAICPDKAQ